MGPCIFKASTSPQPTSRDIYSSVPSSNPLKSPNINNPMSISKIYPNTTTEVITEEQQIRNSNKSLTVIQIQSENLSPSEDLPDFPLVRRPSLGKLIQGSLFVSKSQEFDDFSITNSFYPIKDSNLELLPPNLGASCVKGLKPDTPNQDDFFILTAPDSFLIGVFDGHGPHGHAVSNFTHTALPYTLLTSPFWVNDKRAAFITAFTSVHNDLISHCHKKLSQFDCTFSGTTATLIHKIGDKLYAAHVGDSRAVIGRRLNDKIKGIALTRDHRPVLEDESARIEIAGGEVKKLEGDENFRVFLKGRRIPGIAISRSIGDEVAQKIGVICEPDVRVVELVKEDEFVLVCSDGVWDYINDGEAVRLVDKHRKDTKKAVDKLVRLARSRWVSNRGGVVDDITVIIAFLY